MGDDEAALIRLWKEKRGEGEPEDLSGNLIVQLGSSHRRPQSPLATRPTPARSSPTSKSTSGTRACAGWRRRSTVWWKSSGWRPKPNSCCPGYFSEEAALEKYAPAIAAQYVALWPPDQRSFWLSPAAANGLTIATHADPLYQHLISHRRKRAFPRRVAERSAPGLVRHRAAQAAHRGGACCRYDPHRTLGRSSPRFLPGCGQHISNTNSPRRSLRARCRRTISKPSAMAFGPSARSQGPSAWTSLEVREDDMQRS